MTVRERMLSLRLLEKEENNPTYMKRLGVSVAIKRKTGTKPEKGRNSNV